MCEGDSLDICDICESLYSDVEAVICMPAAVTPGEQGTVITINTITHNLPVTRHRDLVTNSGHRSRLIRCH